MDKKRCMGRHLILDAWECPERLLNDPDHVRRAVQAAITACNASLIELCVHRFNPCGVTATATLAESHIAVHTWPEHGYFAADIFFCGPGDPGRALNALRDLMQAGRCHIRNVLRGIDPLACLETMAPMSGCGSHTTEGPPNECRCAETWKE